MSQFLEGHSVRRYDGDLNHLHVLVLEMAGLALEQTRTAVDALKSGRVDDSRRVIEREHDVDALELKLDDEIWWVVGRRAPVARDLRVVMAFSKAVTDLERIGDEAARIAQLSVGVYDSDVRPPSRKMMRDVHVIGRVAITMLEEAVSLLDSLDAEGAQALLNRNTDLDAEFQSALRRLSTFILEDARNVGHAVNMVLLFKALERIGDHARNLAEYVVYLIRGEDVRHPGAREGEGRPASGA